jgi:cellobiose transport system substrate-binding protein
MSAASLSAVIESLCSKLYIWLVFNLFFQQRRLHVVIQSGGKMKKFGKASVASAIVLGLLGAGVAALPAQAATITLTIGDFGDMGLKELFKVYEKKNPGIKIVEKSSEFNAHHQGVMTSFAAGKGNDINAIEAGWMPAFVPYASKFLDLRNYGGAALEKDYLAWRWKPAVAKNGAILGLPTDVGGLALAYRTDLFEAAGLPSDPASVSALWSKTGWNGYLATAKKYTAKTGKKFADTVEGVWSAALNQSQTTFYDKNGNLVYESSKGVQDAWNIATAAAPYSGSAGYWTPEWTAAQGTAATVIAPAWMLNGIKGNVPDLKGKWNVAAVPGKNGNWGGSWLTISKFTKHPKESAALIKWLMAPAQQKTIFITKGNFPSAVAAVNDASVKNYKDPYFSNAPVGKIYAESYKNILPGYSGPKGASIGTSLRDALFTVVQGKNTKEEAWDAAIAEIRKNVGPSK